MLFIIYIYQTRTTKKSAPHDLLQSVGRPRDERRRKTRAIPASPNSKSKSEKNVGVNRVIRVVSTGDLTFSLDDSANSTANEDTSTMVFPVREAQTSNANLICMTTSGFTLTLLLLIGILLGSCGLSAYLCIRLRPFRKRIDESAVHVRGFPIHAIGKSAALKSACFYS